MVAYSFKGQFKAPIERGTKRQTIRAVGKRRHARPGEKLQLYVGMRTPRCELVKRVTCKSVSDVELHFSLNTTDQDFVNIFHPEWKSITGMRSLNAFARRDAFDSWSDLRAFWRLNHPGVNNFKGVLITW